MNMNVLTVVRCLKKWFAFQMRNETPNVRRARAPIPVNRSRLLQPRAACQGRVLPAAAAQTRTAVFLEGKNKLPACRAFLKRTPEDSNELPRPACKTKSDSTAAPH